MPFSIYQGLLPPWRQCFALALQLDKEGKIRKRSKLTRLERKRHRWKWEGERERQGRGYWYGYIATPFIRAYHVLCKMDINWLICFSEAYERLRHQHQHLYREWEAFGKRLKKQRGSTRSTRPTRATSSQRACGKKRRESFSESQASCLLNISIVIIHNRERSLDSKQSVQGRQSSSLLQGGEREKRRRKEEDRRGTHKSIQEAAGWC